MTNSISPIPKRNLNFTDSTPPKKNKLTSLFSSASPFSDSKYNSPPSKNLNSTLTSTPSYSSPLQNRNISSPSSLLNRINKNPFLSPYSSNHNSSSINDENSYQSNPKCPPTPYGKGRETKNDPFIENRKTIVNEKHWVNSKGEIIELIPTTLSGQYNRIYTVDSNSPQMISGKNNKEILLRVFKEIRAFNDKQDKMKHQRQNYLEAHLAGLPTIDFLNFDTMMTDGFIAVPYVPHEFHLYSENPNIPNEFLLNPQNLKAVQEFLKVCYELDLSVDAKNGTITESNFRSKTADGLPTLIDIKEYGEDRGKDDFYCFYRHLHQNILPTWAKKESALFDDLDPSILNTNWDSKSDFSHLTEQNVIELFRGIEKLKRNHTIFVKSKEQLAPQAFQSELLEIRKDLRLDTIPMATLKALLRFKQNLPEHFINPEAEPYTLKFRDQQGNVRTILSCMRSNYNSMDEVKAHVIELISNGNPHVKAFLEA